MYTFPLPVFPPFLNTDYHSMLAFILSKFAHLFPSFNSPPSFQFLFPKPSCPISPPPMPVPFPSHHLPTHSSKTYLATRTHLLHRTPNNHPPHLFLCHHHSSILLPRAHKQRRPPAQTRECPSHLRCDRGGSSSCRRSNRRKQHARCAEEGC